MRFNDGDKVIVVSRTSLYGVKGVIEGKPDCGGYNFVTASGTHYWCLHQELQPDGDQKSSSKK